MTEYVQLVGSDDPLASGAALLWTEEYRVAFNCPEGTQRFCSEAKIRLPRVSCYFFTRVTPHSMMGFPGVLFTVNDASVTKIKAVGHAPTLQSTWEVLNDTFFYHRKMDFTVEEAAQHVTPSASHSSTRIATRPFTVGGCEVYTVVHSDHAESAVAAPLYSYLCAPTRLPRFDVDRARAMGVQPGPKYAKLRRGEAVTSDANPQVSVAPSDVLVQPGPVGAILLVDCDGPQGFPDLVSCVAPFGTVAGEDGEQPAMTIHTIVHLAPYHVVSLAAYGHRIDAVCRRYGRPVRHVVATGPYRARITAFPTALANRAHLKLISPEFVLLPPSDDDEQDAVNREEDSAGAITAQLQLIALTDEDSQQCKFAVSAEQSDAVMPRSVDSIVWRYARRFNLRTGCATMEEAVTYPTEAVARSMLSEEFQRKFLPNPATPPPTLPSQSDEIAAVADGTSDHDVGVDCFGTGSAVPSKYRNVSCTVLRLPSCPQPSSVRRLILDCGEGSLGQIWNATVGSRRKCGNVAGRRDGADALMLYIASIRAVFISHMHADHHLGIFTIVSFRDYVSRVADAELVGSNRLDEPLLVFAPSIFCKFYSRMLDVAFHELRSCAVTLVSTDAFLNRPLGYGTPETTTNSDGDVTLIESICRREGLSLTVFTVDHPACALGLRVDCYSVADGAQCKPYAVVYSGDTQPCDSVTRYCAGVDLVIHEATFADGMTVEARQKRHSTVSEAIAAGRTATAVLLNHFSQRYPKLPTLAPPRTPTPSISGTGVVGSAESTGPIVAVAFDLLRVRSTAKIAALSALTPSYQALLAEYESWGDGTSKRLRDMAST
jgi:ribonuclease Z